MERRGRSCQETQSCTCSIRPVEGWGDPGWGQWPITLGSLGLFFLSLLPFGPLWSLPVISEGPEPSLSELQIYFRPQVVSPSLQTHSSSDIQVALKHLRPRLPGLEELPTFLYPTARFAEEETKTQLPCGLVRPDWRCSCSRPWWEASCCVVSQAVASDPSACNIQAQDTFKSIKGRLFRPENVATPPWELIKSHISILKQGVQNKEGVVNVFNTTG